MRLRLSNPPGRGLPILFAFFAPVTALVAITVWISLAQDIEIGQFTRDPAVLTDSSPFTGLFSSVGVLFWCATAAICLFGTVILRSSPKSHEIAVFLLGAGLITTMLMLDDLFMFHEVVFPQYLHFGEKVTVLLYGIILVSFLWYFRQRVIQTDYSVLLIAFAFLGFSVVSDRLLTDTGSWSYFIEDGPKLFGIVAWFSYWSRVCWSNLKRFVQFAP